MLLMNRDLPVHLPFVNVDYDVDFRCGSDTRVWYCSMDLRIRWLKGGL